MLGPGVPTSCNCARVVPLPSSEVKSDEIYLVVLPTAGSTINTRLARCHSLVGWVH